MYIGDSHYERKAFERLSTSQIVLIGTTFIKEEPNCDEKWVNGKTLPFTYR